MSCRRTYMLRQLVGGSSQHDMQLIYMDRYRSKGSFIPNSLCNLYITLKVPVFSVYRDTALQQYAHVRFLFFFHINYRASFDRRCQPMALGWRLWGTFTSCTVTCECSSLWLPFTHTHTNIRHRRIFGCGMRTWTDTVHPYFWKRKQPSCITNIRFLFQAPRCLSRGSAGHLPARLCFQRIVCQWITVEVQRFGVLQQLNAVPLCSIPRPREFRFCGHKGNKIIC